MHAYTLRDSLPSLNGIVTMRTYAVESEEAERLDRVLRTAANINPASFRAMLRRLERHGGVTPADTRRNLVVASGRAVFARILGNDTTYTGIINYGALGSGSTAPAAADTALETEVFRKAVASRSVSSTSTTIDFYYSKADVSGTFEEFGCFIDGAATADSGQLYNRLLTGGWAKSGTEAMTVSVQFDINAS